MAGGANSAMRPRQRSEGSVTETWLATAEDVEPCAEVLARAFSDDPGRLVFVPA